VQGSVAHGGAQNISPFLSLTDFHMSQPTFAPHPHAGFSAVTYLFLDSVGSFTNRDSFGDESTISPGSLHWTQAGSGMMHEEVPSEPGIDCHGLQLFVNLQGADKQATPAAFHLDVDDIPEIEPSDGVFVRVVVGSCNNVKSPLDGLLTPINFLDIHLAPGKTFTANIPSEHRAVVLVVRGSVTISDTVFRVNTAATLEGPDSGIEFLGGPKGTNVILLSGEPIREAVVFAGPFAMTTDDEIADAQKRFRRGDMGHLAPSF
jgi:redox-sensitive bicupin YhaK (pirin superfamily)